MNYQPSARGRTLTRSSRRRLLRARQDVAACTHLTWLSFKDNAVTSLAPLAPLQKLRVLNAGGNRIAKLDGVEALRELRALIVNDNVIDDLSCAWGLPPLRPPCRLTPAPWWFLGSSANHAAVLPPSHPAATSGS